MTSYSLAKSASLLRQQANHISKQGTWKYVHITEGFTCTCTLKVDSKTSLPVLHLCIFLSTVLNTKVFGFQVFKSTLVSQLNWNNIDSTLKKGCQVFFKNNLNLVKKCFSCSKWNLLNIVKITTLGSLIEGLTNWLTTVTDWLQQLTDQTINQLNACKEGSFGRCGTR